MAQKAPYHHQDGSNCWTKDCRLGNDHTLRQSLMTSVQKNSFGQKQNTPAPENTHSTAAHIDSIASQQAFDEAALARRVSRTRHPEFPYSIYKYSQQTTYKKDWDDITLASRGLIVNDETGEIMARPFSKFFNYNEDSVPKELMTGPVVVMEKLDGSLGITYRAPNGEMRISTAGGFSSEQAEHATKIYSERYEGKWNPDPNKTYLYEIIYPENRIVVDYGEEDDIYLLGAVDRRTGVSTPLHDITEWKWKRAVEHTSLDSLSKVLESPERENHEGYIVHYTDTDARVKYKHEEYLLHHRYATGITSRAIWENLREGVDDSAWIAAAPEEFEGYITEKRNEILNSFKSEKARISKVYEDFMGSLPEGLTDKQIAAEVNSRVPVNDRSFIFSLRGVNGDWDYRNEEGKLRMARAIKTVWDRVKPPVEKLF